MRLDYADSNESVELDTRHVEEFNYDELPVGKDTEEYLEKLLEKYNKISIPQRRIDEFKNKFDCVVVNDFGDDYHLTEEEREANNKYYAAFRKFSRCKKKYRKIDEYILAVREAIKCLDYVANNNGQVGYTPEEFKKDFLKGKIQINGLSFPKFIGRDAKRISSLYLTEFILSDEDPSVILKELNKVDEVLSEEELEELSERLFTKEELDKITTPVGKDVELFDSTYVDPDEDDLIDKNVCVEMDKKETKKLVKTIPEIAFVLKDEKIRSRQLDSISKFAYDFSLEDIEDIATYDTTHNKGFIGKSDMPEFTGDIFDNKSYEKYLFELDEWANSHITDEYMGKTRTLEQIEELKIKQRLEEGGWNIRAFADTKEKEEKLKKIKKEEKKREKRLKAKLLSIQKDRDNRKRKLGVDYDDEDVESIKKEKKLAKKKKKSKKKAKEAADDILLRKNGKSTFGEWKDDVLDWRDL